MRKFTALLTMLAVLVMSGVARADYQYLSKSGVPAPYLLLTGLSGQSTCAISVPSTFTGSLTVDGIYQNATAYTTGLTVYSPDGVTNAKTITAPGNYTTNCATMVALRVNSSAASGVPSLTINASGGVAVLFGSSGSGGATPAPVSITSANSNLGVSNPSTNTFVLTAVTPPPPNITSSNTNTTIATPAPNTFVFTTVTPAPPTITAGAGTSVATPAPNTYVISNTGVTAVTASGNAISSGGSTPNISVTAAPVFTQVTDSALTTGNCVQAGTAGILTNATGACGTVTSVSGTGNIASTGGTTPVVSITAAPVFSQITDSALTSGRCVQAGTGGILTASAAACASGSGTVTAVTGSGNIASSGGTTPNVTITDAPTFTGPVSAASVNTGAYNMAGFEFWTSQTGCSVAMIASGTGTLPVQGIYPSILGIDRYAGCGANIDVFNLDSAGNMGVLSGLYAGTLNGANITSGNCVQGSAAGLLVSTSAACGSVTSVTAGTGITVGGTAAAPTVALTTPITIANGGTGVTTLTGARCVDSNTAGSGFVTMDTLCPVTTTSASFVVPAVGASVAVSVRQTGAIAKNAVPITVSDGTTTMYGMLTAGAVAGLGGGTYTVTNIGVGVGAVGATVAAGAVVYPGAAALGTTSVVNLGFGYITGAVTTVGDYPTQQIPGYTNGKLTKLRASCKGADNGTTVFTFTDTTTATTIGTIAMANTSKTGTTTLGTPFTLTPGDQVQAAVTTAGTATGCGLTAEGTAQII